MSHKDDSNATELNGWLSQKERIAALESLVRDMYDVAARGEFDVGEEARFNGRMRELGIEV